MSRPAGGKDAMDESERAQRFEVRLLERYEDWWVAAHFRAGRFKPLVTRRGGVGAAKYLVTKPGVSSGFSKLHAAGRLDLSIECLILELEFAPLFTERERAVARRRLQDHRATC